MVVRDAKAKFPRLLSLPEALEEIGRPQTQWNEQWLKRTIKNNYITYSKTGTKWFITEEDLWELLRSIEVRCYRSTKGKKEVRTTKLKTLYVSQTGESTELEKVQDALRLKTQKDTQSNENEKSSRNLKIKRELS
tara:strand:- start:1020 stop:1424 length:405 start_codon:yes stop_codon:yes gene_type:complete